MRDTRTERAKRRQNSVLLDCAVHCFRRSSRNLGEEGSALHVSMGFGLCFWMEHKSHTECFAHLLVLPSLPDHLTENERGQMPCLSSHIQTCRDVAPYQVCDSRSIHLISVWLKSPLLNLLSDAVCWGRVSLRHGKYVVYLCMLG
jgi:hypothetical protein